MGEHWYRNCKNLVKSIHRCLKAVVDAKVYPILLNNNLMTNENIYKYVKDIFF